MTTTNNFTVTVADAHSHSIAQAGVPGEDRIDAALAVLQALADQEAAYAAFNTGDTWTISVTQP
jgi:hypothetical protein